jgi:hypothetical protein
MVGAIHQPQKPSYCFFQYIGFPNNWHIAFPNALLAHPNNLLQADS